MRTKAEWDAALFAAVQEGDLAKAGGALAEGYVLDDIIECPMHNGRFHIPTGRVEGPPACEPLGTYRVRVAGGALEIWLDPS